MSQTSGGLWNIPPPPGTEQTDSGTAMDTSVTRSLLKNCLSYPSLDVIRSTDSFSESDKIEYDDKSRRKHERNRSPSRHQWRNKERLQDYDRRHKYKKRSRSRSHHQTRHSRSHEHRRHKCSRSRSHSHNRSSSRRGRYNEKRHKHSSSRRSRSKSQKYHHHHSHQNHSSSSSHSHDSEYNRNVSDSRQNSGDGDDDEDTPTKENVFKNDGSFLEMFKKMQEEQKVAEAAQKINVVETIDKPFIPPPFGKRRGGRVLKTGMVQKTRTVTENDLTKPQDAWSVYMKEVKRYKEACCDDDSKTRPLVK